MKKNKFISIILAISLLCGLMPTVFAGSVSTTYIDLKDFENSPNDTYAAYLGSRIDMGRGALKSGLGGKETTDSFLDVSKQNTSDNLRFTFVANGKQNFLYNLATPIVLSLDVYSNNVISGITFETTSSANLIGGTIANAELVDSGNNPKWTNVAVVFAPTAESKIKVYVFVDGAYRSETEMAAVTNSGDDYGQMRFKAIFPDAANSAGKHLYLDNMKLYQIDEFKNPEVPSGLGFINDEGKIVNYYGKTAGEILALVPLNDKKIVKADGTALTASQYPSAGMKLKLQYTVTKADGETVEAVFSRDLEFATIVTDIQKAKALVTIPTEVNDDNNLTLPTTITNETMTAPVTVSWSSSNESVLSSTGVVNRPMATDAVVTLSATYSNVVESETVNYNVTVKSQGNPTTVSMTRAGFATQSAVVGDKVGYYMEYYDDYGIYDIPYTISCTDTDLTIDTARKTVTSQKPGVYTVKFTATGSGETIEKKISFSDTNERLILDTGSIVYTEDFEGTPDGNILLSGSNITEKNSSNAMYLEPKSGTFKSAQFGSKDAAGKVEQLTDYTIDFDLFVEKCVNGGTPGHFTVRMRDNGSEGYNFSFHTFVFENAQGQVGAAGTGTRRESVFTASRGTGEYAAEWKYGNVDEVGSIFDGTGFKKVYHVVASTLGGKLVGKVIDPANDTVIFEQTTDLKTLDNSGTAIEKGATRFVNHATGGYVDNVVISKPRWISDIKIETDASMVKADNPETGYKVYGKSTNDEWIELTSSEYTISGTGVTAANGKLTFSGTGKHEVIVNSGSKLYFVKNVEVADNADEMQSIYDNLTIANADNVKEDFSLPTVSGCSIVWSTTDSSAARIDGNIVRVTRPAEGEADKRVTLKAKVYSNTVMVEKEIQICIKAHVTDATAVAKAIEGVTVPTSTSSNLTLPTQSAEENVAISWSSGNTAVISDSGVVTQPTYTTTVNLTATFTRGGVTQTHTYVVSVVGTKGSKPEGDGGNGSGGGGGGGFKGNYDFTFGAGTVTTPSAGANTPADTELSFGDVAKDSWYYNAVNTLFRRRIISGVSENAFEPECAVTREEFLKLVCSVFDLKADGGELNYVDVPADSWFAEYVRVAVECGIVRGVSDTEFGAGTPISRQDMCVMLVRALEYAGKKIANAANADFADNADIADYANEAVYVLKALGIVSGSDGGVFLPNNSTTRAESATVIMNVLTKYGM